MTNNLEEMTLSDAELRRILSQKPGEGASRLTYYETLNINVTPQEGTSFDPLVGKTTYYRASSGGKWVNTLENQTVTKETLADLKNLNSDFWPYGFRIDYRADPNSTYTKTIPVGVDLSNKTLEEQLATLLNIDLNSNPDGVIDEYKNLYVFKPLNNYIYLTRFDFYSEKEGVTPVVSGGLYDVDSLNLLGTYYVSIKYHKTSPTMAEQNIVNKTSNSYFVISSCLFLLGLGGYLYYKKFKLVK